LIPSEPLLWPQHLKTFIVKNFFFSLISLTTTVCKGGFIYILFSKSLNSTNFHPFPIQTLYTHFPIIRTSRIRTAAEFLGKFKSRAVGSSNLRTTSKNLRTATAQIVKAKNRVCTFTFFSTIYHLYVNSNFSLFLFLSVQHLVLNHFSLLLWCF
jgi:hypothetical protein